MMLRLFWLSVIEVRRPELCPPFFETDLALPIIRFTSRPEGGCYREWIKGPNCIVHPVQLWFLSVLPVLLSTTQLWDVLYVRGNDEYSAIPEYVVKDGLVPAILALNSALSVFCLQCVRVALPGGFQGERDNVMSITVANAWRILGRSGCLPVTIAAVMWLAYAIYLVRMAVYDYTF